MENNEIKEVKLNKENYDMTNHVHNLQANNECRLRFSYLPELTEEESLEYFNKSIPRYLDTLFFCNTMFKNIERTDEFVSANLNRNSKYYISLKEG